MYDVKQLKLNSGHEILCEVIQWPSEGQVEIVVRNCMQISPQKDASGTSYYVFNTWMHYQESSTDLLIINSDHIIAIANPGYALLNQYLAAAADMNLTGVERENKHRQEEREALAAITKSISTSKPLSKKTKVEPKDNDSDSPNNIISFPTR